MHNFGFIEPLNLLVVRYGARVDDQKLFEISKAAVELPTYRRGADEIHLFHRTELAVTGEGLRSMARYFANQRGEEPVANRIAIVTVTQLGYGLARMYEAYRNAGEDSLLRAFETCPEACGWIDAERGRPLGTTHEMLQRVG